MGSTIIDINRLIQLGVVPSALKDDPVINAFCQQTRLSVTVRESLIIVYIQMLERR